MTSLENFKSQFKFNPELVFHVGVERECFITDQSGVIVPKAPLVLAHILENGWTDIIGQPVDGSHLADIVGYELSACQIETRTKPCSIDEIEAELYWQDQQLSQSLLELGLISEHEEVAPETMPLDVYPDPTGRYANLAKTMPRDVLLAACRVIGTHVHVGMPDHDTALHVYNRVIEECDSLCHLGDSSGGERLSIYKIVAPDAKPEKITSWQTFYERAVKQGFVSDPRKCWTLIRISGHGTIEFRMFGATNSIERIVSWTKRCHELCLHFSKC